MEQEQKSAEQLAWEKYPWDNDPPTADGEYWVRILDGTELKAAFRNRKWETTQRVLGWRPLPPHLDLVNMPMEQLRRKRHQAWEMADTTRQAGDAAGQQRHTRDANTYAEEIGRRIRAGEK